MSNLLTSRSAFVVWASLHGSPRMIERYAFLGSIMTSCPINTPSRSHLGLRNANNSVLRFPDIRYCIALVPDQWMLSRRRKGHPHNRRVPCYGLVAVCTNCAPSVVLCQRNRKVDSQLEGHVGNAAQRSVCAYPLCTSLPLYLMLRNRFAALHATPAVSA